MNQIINKFHINLIYQNIFKVTIYYHLPRSLNQIQITMQFNIQMIFILTLKKITLKMKYSNQNHLHNFLNKNETHLNIFKTFLFLVIMIHLVYVIINYSKEQTIQFI